MPSPVLLFLEIELNVMLGNVLKSAESDGSAVPMREEFLTNDVEDIAKGLVVERRC